MNNRATNIHAGMSDTTKGVICILAIICGIALNI